MEEKRYPVIRYTTLVDGTLEYHSAYNLTPIGITNLRSNPATKDITHPYDISR